MAENSQRPVDTVAGSALACVFEPFQDRLSRDIRNSLSRALALALAKRDPALFETMAASLLSRDPDRCYKDYIESRLNRYRLAFARSQPGDQDPFRQGLVLWDLQLFFEMHEVLEHAWYHAKGNRKTVLQAMIRAGGVYVKLEYGYTRQAAKIAAKALTVLEGNTALLGEYFAPGKLLQALRTLAPTPPVLLGDDEGPEQSQSKKKAPGTAVPEA
jgi:uncharacterized protein